MGDGMEKTKRKIWIVTLMASAATLTVGAHALAANSDGTAADQGTRLEEITVTARRRAENVQTVPIAITVVSQQTLEENHIETVTDLQYVVPSLSASTNAPNMVRLD